MKDKFESTDNSSWNSIVAGIPVEPELTEPWRKKRFSCSGNGRIEKNFDFKYLDFLAKDEQEN